MGNIREPSRAKLSTASASASCAFSPGKNSSDARDSMTSMSSCGPNLPACSPQARLKASSAPGSPLGASNLSSCSPLPYSCLSENSALMSHLSSELASASTLAHSASASSADGLRLNFLHVNKMWLASCTDISPALAKTSTWCSSVSKASLGNTCFDSDLTSEAADVTVATSSSGLKSNTLGAATLSIASTTPDGARFSHWSASKMLAI
mmetsp:Transcript_23187/g.78951  ORF Transcript_23187/g.78951 Transcript_23187/m.78951 type:complete len:209 (+) Transcript_23187:325-951(+)